MTGRLSHLDGLRGVAAAFVVIHHLVLALMPWALPNYELSRHAVAYTPLAVLWNGPFCVAVFFVLSGFVVSQATLRKGDPIWVDAIVRYLRLAVPSMLAVLLAWVLLKALPHAATDLATVTGAPWLALTYHDTIPGLPHALYDGLIGIFLRGQSWFDNVLWTMRAELVGSLICFVVCQFSVLRVRLALCAVFAVLALFAHHYEYESFVAGILIREAWAARRLGAVMPLAAVFIGMLLGSRLGEDAAKAVAAHIPHLLHPTVGARILDPIGAALVLYGCMTSPALRALLAGRTAQFFGAISFPLYLIHVPIITTVLAALYVAAQPSAALAAASVALCLVGIVVLAWLAELGVERPLLRGLGRLRRVLNIGSAKALARLPRPRMAQRATPAAG